MASVDSYLICYLIEFMSHLYRQAQGRKQDHKSLIGGTPSLAILDGQSIITMRPYSLCTSVCKR